MLLYEQSETVTLYGLIKDFLWSQLELWIHFSLHNLYFRHIIFLIVITNDLMTFQCENWRNGGKLNVFNWWLITTKVF